MSVEVWPYVAPEQLKIEEDASLVSHAKQRVPQNAMAQLLPSLHTTFSHTSTLLEELDEDWLLVPTYPRPVKELTPFIQARELNWLLSELQTTLKTLKSSLEETYALLAPIDPGSTLVVSTPRQEAVKGHVTRVGTRLVKGSIHLRLKTVPHQMLTLDPANPIHIPELTTLNTLLTQSVDILSFIVTESTSPSGGNGNNATAGVDPKFLSSQLRLLSEYLSESLFLIKGPHLIDQAQEPTADTAWTSSSVPPSCFNPPLPANISFYLTLQDASLVLFLRALEPADAPVAFGTKFALAIGTTRRLEHDEADRVFAFCPEGADAQSPITEAGSVRGTLHRTKSGGRGGGMGKGRGTETQVYVREKVRVESADPSLMSLSAKLGALGHTLLLARKNLAVVMGEDFDIGA
ncbi:putative RAVE subunit 2/Rogdi [Seiridium cardinale]|uniref:RAVE subunit 2/Rogdi n=1 Tax=Seiridium cardinale TaxID=138064 RepID=A0ABR2XGH6_9PEZI